MNDKQQQPQSKAAIQDAKAKQMQRIFKDANKEKQSKATDANKAHKDADESKDAKESQMQSKQQMQR